MVKDLSNGIKFVNRSNEDESFISDIIKDLENPNYYKNVATNDGLDYVYLQNGHLEAVSQSTRWYGFGGTNVKLFLEAWQQKYDELNKYKKNTITRIFTNNLPITISKSYGDHEFTDKEIEKLFNGESVTITFNTQYGNSRTITGKIEKKDWPEKEIEFYTFVTHDLDNQQESNIIEGVYQGQIIKFKNQFADYKFTDEDIKKLLNGNSIYCVITNSNGNRGAVRLKLVHMNNDYYKVHPDWEVPRYRFSERDREFTGQELEDLHIGKSIVIDNLVGKNGGHYSAEIRWKDGKYQIKK